MLVLMVLTFAPYASSSPDLCTLHAVGVCRWLQLALVVLFHAATSPDSLLAHVVVAPSSTCSGDAYI